MTELDKLKAFISNFYATDYMTELGYGGMFVALIAILISCADGVNGFELILMIVILAIETAVIVLHIRKRMNNIFLYSGLGAIAFSSMAVLLFTNYASHIGENYILSVITFTGLFFIMPAIMSWVAVIRRIGNGYYAKSMERTNLFNWNPTSYLGLAVGVVAVTRILTDAMDEDLKGILSLLFLATMAWIFSYNGTEHMLRHYFIRRYNLEDAIRIRPNIII